MDEHASCFTGRWKALILRLDFGVCVVSDGFVLIGVELYQRPDGSRISLGMADYTRALTHIALSRARRLENTAPATTGELHQFRSLAGAMQWPATQVAANRRHRLCNRAVWAICAYPT